MQRNEMEAIIKNNPTVFIVGAGLSTASGIQDFASLQKKFDTTALLSHEAYYQHFWEQHDFMAKYLMNQNAQPNLGHAWIADLSHQIGVRVISQNIDNLLEQAHIEEDHLLKIHGSIDRFIDRAGNPVAMTETEYQHLPHTPDNPMIRPDIVFYGENVKGMDQALTWMQSAKNVIVVGTRLNVSPVNQLTLWAKQLEHIFVINQEPVHPLQNNVPVTQITTDITEWLRQ
ncbi:hypothetical protein D3P96_00220 [Weissella viridescens]|uniref:protein acetyllysine N-acetyltransferase n=1 Tax=Weissella viridescens TaxID=1629 RepID=A0A3P2RCI2_WEIVI|nr:Sir2 family NAD-dependent protein deacetylase [Weissella viridescens]RRG18449.1 hypothetical protein D3P96_00220 [Weissella viridescens]